MDKLKQWVALTVVACLAIVAAGWFLLVAPKRSEAADLRAQAEEQVAANAKLHGDLQVLKAQAKDLPKEQAKLAAVTAKIPSDPALPGLVRSLLEAADGAGVELVSITPGAPAVIAAPAPVAAPVEDDAAAQQGPDANGAGAEAAAAAAPSPAGQLAGIPLAVEVVGEYFEIQQFFGAVEELTRAIRVESLQMAPGESPAATNPDADAVAEGRRLTATVTGFAYMAAHRPEPITATVPGAEGVTTEANPAEPVADDAVVAE
jgi:Tfp pilus assembly protein PilO